MSITTKETTNGSVSTSKSRGGHCKRFWWVYLLVLLVIIVIVVPVIILVAVPKIAQQKVDAATMHVDGIIISQSETNSLHMAINSSISADGSTHATLAAFTGTMYLLDYDPVFEFASVDFPETATDSLVLVNVSQHVPIEHLTELTIFNTYLFSRESINIRIKGDTTVRVSGIARDYPVTFDKTIQMVGFNTFAGLTVENAHVSLSAENNFNGTTTIPNPTIWTIETGNVTFYTFFNGTNVGTTSINNLVLYPGNNSYFTSGTIDQGSILNALAQQPYCSNGGLLPLGLTAKTVVDNGQDIPWLSGALGSKNVTVTVDIGGAIKNDIGFTVSCANSTSS